MPEICHCDECDYIPPLINDDGEVVECSYCTRPLVEGQLRFCSRECARAAEADNDDG